MLLLVLLPSSLLLILSFLLLLFFLFLLSVFAIFLFLPSPKLLALSFLFFPSCTHNFAFDDVPALALALVLLLMGSIYANADSCKAANVQRPNGGELQLCNGGTVER